LKSRLRVAVATFVLLFVLPGIARADVLLTPSTGSPVTATGQGGVVKSADFNSDGLDDLAIASNQAATGGVYIRLANGDGTWSSKATVGAGAAVGEIAVGDLNGDEDPDLLVNFPDGSNPYTASGSFKTFLGNGDGTFIAGQSLTLPGNKVVAMLATGQAMKLADVNGDTKPDLWMALLGGQIGVTQGAGDGTFSTVGVISSFPGVQTEATEGFGTIATGDFNGDDQDDYVFGLVGRTPTGVSEEEDSGFYVMYGLGDSASFETPVHVSIASPYGPVAGLAVTDANGDGFDDLITQLVIGGTDSRIEIYRGSASGFTSFPTSIQSPSGTRLPMIAADFSVDDNLDIGWIEHPMLVGTTQPNNLKLALGSSSGTFSLQSDITDLNFSETQSSAAHATSGDFNGDGAPDLATSFRSTGCATQACGVSVLLNSPVVTPSPSSLDFGTVTQTATQPSLPLTVTNTGSAVTRINGAAGGSNINVTWNCGLIPAGGSCPMQVTLNANVIGTVNTTINIGAQGVDHMIEIPVTGTVVAPPTYKASLKLTGPKKVKAGKKFRITARTTNTGTGDLNGVTLKWKAAQGKATKAQGQLKLATIPRGKSLSSPITVAIPRKKLVKGKPVQITVTAIRQGKSVRTEKFSVKQEFGPQKADRR